MTDELPDALAEALGSIIADLRKEWRKELEVVTAESRATIAELKAANADLLAALRDNVSTEVKRVDAALANVRNGQDVDQVAVERTIVEHVYAAVEAATKSIRVPEDGKSVEPEVVQRMVDEAVAAIRVPEDGKSVTLADVQPLLDEARAALQEQTKADLGEAVVAILVDVETNAKRVLETAVAGIRVPEDGKSVTLAEVQPVIDEALKSLREANEREMREAATLWGSVVDEAIAAIPQVKDGTSVTLDDVRPILDEAWGEVNAQFDAAIKAAGDAVNRVETAIAAIPEVKDGTSVTLDDVRPLIDEIAKGLREQTEETLVSVGDEARAIVEKSFIALAETTERSVADHVTRAVGALPKPKDGTSVTLDDVRPLIDEAVKALPPAPAGQDVDMDEVKALVTRTLDNWPKPKDGESVTVEQVQPLIAKEVETAVKAIPVPKDGAGLADAVIDRDHNLILTMTDGRTKNMGRVVGKDAEQDAMLAVLREDFAKAIAEIPKPKDGEDGLGFDDMSVDHDGERTIILRWSRGEVTKEARIVMPVVLDRGVYSEGKSYERGDGVTWGGSFWIAQDDTNEKPGEGKTAWRLSIKKPRDGKDVVRLPAEPTPYRFAPKKGE
ncbi:hypothetical protein [EBPR siphovirus 3]|nr:hypothetical protein [EBPR siphovirus 3]